MIKKILTLVVVFCVAFKVAELLAHRSHTVTAQKRSVTRLTDCIAAELRGLKLIQRRNGKIELMRFSRKVAGAWHFESPALGDADQELLEELSTLSCEYFEPEPAQKPSEAEFASLDISEGENSSPKIRISFARGASGKVLLTSNHVNYFLAQPRFVSLLSLSADQFQNKKIIRAAPEQLREIKVFIHKKMKIHLVRAGDAWRAMDGEKDLGIIAGAGRYVNRLASLRAISIADLNMSPEKCEKLAPDIEIGLVTINGQREAVHFSKPKPDLIACSSERASLFHVHRDMWKYLNERLDKILPR